MGAWLAGVSNPSQRADAGFWLEQLVFQSLQSWAAVGARRQISYWRDGPREVDFVIEDGNGVLAIEVKSSTTVAHSDFNGLRAFQAAFTKKNSQPPRGILLSPATTPLSFGEHLYSLPLFPFAPSTGSETAGDS